jgi:hypothetical protein
MSNCVRLKNVTEHTLQEWFPRDFHDVILWDESDERICKMQERISSCFSRFSHSKSTYTYNTAAVRLR